MAIERFIQTKMTKTKYSLPWIENSIKRLIERKNCTSVLENQAVLTLRTITNGSEHMYRKPPEMHIGNIFPISSPLKLMTMIPIARAKKKKNVKGFGHLLSPSKRRVGDHFTRRKRDFKN